MATPSPKNRAAIYARYSSDMQKVTSIDGQLLLCRKVAARNNLDVVGEFVDAAKFGLTEDARAMAISVCSMVCESKTLT